LKKFSAEGLWDAPQLKFPFLNYLDTFNNKIKAINTPFFI
jgi:hypothetical protein